MFSEYAVLFLKILDNRKLAAIDPAGKKHHEYLQQGFGRYGFSSHGWTDTISSAFEGG